MGKPGSYMSPYKVKQWVADMRRYIGGEKEYHEIALYAGIRHSVMIGMIMDGCDKSMAKRCQAALTRAMNNPSLRSDESTPTSTYNPLRYAHVTRLLEMHRKTPVAKRLFGRAATPEERAAFLRRQKRGG